MRITNNKKKERPQRKLNVDPRAEGEEDGRLTETRDSHGRRDASALHTQEGSSRRRGLSVQVLLHRVLRKPGVGLPR